MQRITHLSNIINKRVLPYHEIDPRWDYNYFSSLRSLIGEEQVIVVEHNGRYTGYCVWIPDINEILSSRDEINLLNTTMMKIGNRVKGCRILRFGFRDHHHTGYLMADGLISRAIENMRENGYTHCTTGPLFESDKNNHVYNHYLEKWCSSQNNCSDKVKLVLYKKMI
jgi:hypothetical protein